MNEEKKNNQLYITAGGLAKLKEEYDHLINVRRKEVAERIRSARELGDLSENAEYNSAREEQGFVEGRVAEIEGILANSEVVEKPVKSGEVSVGSKVVVELESEELTFWIVGPAEASPTEGKISNESPVGQALLGKKAGDVAEVELPEMTVHYRVKKIE